MKFYFMTSFESLSEKLKKMLEKEKKVFDTVYEF